MLSIRVGGEFSRDSAKRLLIAVAGGAVLFVVAFVVLILVQ